MKVALIIESSNRMKVAPAHEFYCGKSNRWVASVLNYLKEVKFSTEHIYFLSFHEQRVIPYEEVITDYPINPGPTVKEQRNFANRIISFVKERYEGAEVNIHAGKSITDYLIPLFKQERIPYVIFAEGQQLLKKAKVYEELIEQERALKRIRDMQREKEQIIAIPSYFTPLEAERIVTEYGPIAHKYGVENLFSEIRLLLRDYKQQQRQAQLAKKAFDQSLELNERKQFQQIFDNLSGLSDLFNSNLAEFRSQNGRSMAMLKTQLIKEGYVKNTVNRISEVMFRLQIVLLKS
ncbi:hypothetical protein [Paenibacillus sp. FSL L8-0709]|uniref:hypothetical protein n=1 Tax=Paenibacillus sp. FSL L8-0709 TaxID=2975312 RepID=UPI0030FAEF59